MCIYIYNYINNMYWGLKVNPIEGSLSTNRWNAPGGISFSCISLTSAKSKRKLEPRFTGLLHNKNCKGSPSPYHHKLMFSVYIHIWIM